MNRRATVVRLLLAVGAMGAALPLRAATYFLIVGGLGGEPDYAELFSAQVAAIEQAARKSAGAARVLALSGAAAGKDAITAAFTTLGAKMRERDDAVVILIGHGSFDGDHYKFNIVGADLSDTELRALFDALPAKNQLIVNTTSASGAAIEPWQAEKRIVITATKSGLERNATRFAEFWKNAFGSNEADTDKNGSLNAQEMFDFAARRVSDTYEQDTALATEHPRIEGALAAAFNVVHLRAGATAGTAASGLLAERQTVERAIEELKTRRTAMTEDAYLDALQALLVDLARIQQLIDAETGSEAGGD